MRSGMYGMVIDLGHVGGVWLGMPFRAPSLQRSETAALMPWCKIRNRWTVCADHMAASV